MAGDERERLLEDGHAALEWVADYLERVRELPVLAQVEPGEVRARLPATAPEEAEPFSAVLRDLDDVLLPGITHWQHPRYFAYFAVTASPPGVLAELLAAALNPVEKGARMLGMRLRKVPVDDAFRMRVDGLDLAEAAVVVPTVGTTSTTSVDPVAAVADLCERTGTWMHVDAAYAGAAMVCPEHRWAFAGVERADSLVVNAHKWMLTPMDCSLLWTSRPEDFRAAFSLIPEYLRTPDAEDALSLSEYGPALGRRFRSLKLWAVLRCHGRAGLQRMIREHVRLAALLAELVEAEPGWELAAPQRFSLVCFRKDASDADNEAILERVNTSGEIFISHTRLHDRYVLRLAIGSERTTEDDVRRAWDAIRHAEG